MLFGLQAAAQYLLPCKTRAISPKASVMGCSSHNRCVSNVAKDAGAVGVMGWYKPRPCKSCSTSSGLSSDKTILER